MEHSREDYENNKNAYFERGDGIYLSKKEFKENKYLKKELENFFDCYCFENTIKYLHQNLTSKKYFEELNNFRCFKEMINLLISYIDKPSNRKFDNIRYLSERIKYLLSVNLFLRSICF